MKQKRALLTTLFVLAGISIATAAFGDGFKPNRPVELVVHSAPGGNTDRVGRAIVRMLEKERLLPQGMQVVNKSATGTLTAMPYLAEKRGGDHTIGVFNDAWIVNPLRNEKAKHTVKDLTPIANLFLKPMIALVKADSPYKSMKDFVEAARKNPGSLKQAGGPPAAFETLTAVLIQKAAGVKWNIVPTSGIRKKVSDLQAGNAQIMIAEPEQVAEPMKTGKVRVIAALFAKRLTVLPAAPTFKEQGIDVPVLINPRGIIGPPGISKEVIAFWEDLFARLVKTSSWKSYMKENREETLFLKGQELAAFLDEQTQLIRSALQGSGVKLVR